MRSIQKKKDKMLNPQQKMSIRFFVLKLLNDPADYEKFDEFLEGKGEFAQEELKNLPSKAFWTMMKGYSEKLANIALKFISLPATSDSNSKKSEQKPKLDCHTLHKIAVVKSYQNF